MTIAALSLCGTYVITGAAERQKIHNQKGTHVQISHQPNIWNNYLITYKNAIWLINHLEVYMNNNNSVMAKKSKNKTLNIFSVFSLYPI